MKKETLKYSDHYEILVALITYLAVCNRPIKSKGKTIDNATAGWLTEYLGLQAKAQDVEYVLDNYKSIFRRSRQQYNGHYRYSLLLRYAHRSYTDTHALDVSDPLPNEELFSLLSFISNKVNMEQEEKRQKENKRNEVIALSIAVLSAVVAAAASIISAMLK